MIGIPNTFHKQLRIHYVTKYEFIFKMFDIPTHFREQGEDCIPKYVEYLLNVLQEEKT